MDDLFAIDVSKDRMTVSLSIKNEEVLNSIDLTPQLLNDWLQSKRIIFGINLQALKDICENPRGVRYPIEVAKGLRSENGENAYLINEVGKEDGSADMADQDKLFNFKNIRTIPSVKSGQLLATIIPPSFGSPGKDVYGNELKAKPGKQLRLRPGKNIVFNNNKIFATTDGQISISENSVNVFPVYEVKGDLDLNTGNIHFIGNVVIHGNVPSGYEIIAGGDVKINGLVEGSNVEAKGSIFISGGIAGQKKAVVSAGVDLHTQYINQGTVRAGNDIQVDNFIMHSDVTAGRSVQCKTAHIIGGTISAGHSIEAGEIGNQHFARTEIYIGNSSDLVQKEHMILEEMKKMKDGLTKLSLLKERLEEKKQISGQLSTVEEQMMEKQHETSIVFVRKLEDLENELETIHFQMENSEQGFLIVHEKIHPNNLLHFSKYTKAIQQPYVFMKFYIDQGEITSVPL